MDNIEAGALGACTACAIQLGADPMLAPFIGAGVAIATRYLLSWAGRGFRRTPVVPPVPPVVGP